MNPAGSRPTLDALIVLGARLNHQGEPGRVAQLRLRHALQVWQEHYPHCRVLLTGARRSGTAASEALAMANWSLNWTRQTWGIDARNRLAACLILDEASHTTAASAANTLPLVQGQGVNSVGLVSDSLHMRRAHYLFRRHFNRHGIEVHPFAAGGLVRHYWRQRRYLWLGKMVLREGGAWLKLLSRSYLNFFRGR